MLKQTPFLKIFGLILPTFFLLTMISPCLSWAQEYPTKTIEIIVPFPPGGLGPVLAGLFAEEAKKYLPKPIIVTHKPGAAGTIGSSLAAKAAPDGHTLLLASSGPITCAPLIQKIDYSPMEFEIMAQIATAPLNLAVPVGSPWKTLSDLVNEAKKNPGTVSCGNAGTYGGIHLPMIRFEKIAGIQLNHVPFKGSGDSMTALAGGHVMSVARFPAEGEPLVEAGKVRILTIFDSKRCKFYPNAPTSKEEGHPMEAMAWRTIFAPKGTPKPVLAYWNNIIKKVTEDRSFVEKAEKLKMNIEFKSAEDLKRDIQKEIQNFSELAKELGLKPM